MSQVRCHGSSGIGRSGVFVAADVVLRKLRALRPDDISGAKEAVNLKNLVIELRRRALAMRACAVLCCAVLGHAWAVLRHLCAWVARC